MKISVIVPTYKPQSYLWTCLDSLSGQTFPKDDYEVILVLNGCREPYYSQIQEYVANTRLNINFIHSDTGGVSNARNIGLDIASGEYVTFIDDDDYVSPLYLQELYDKSDEKTIVLAYPYAFNDGNDEQQISYAITDTYDAMSSNGRMPFSSEVRKYFNGPWMKLIPMNFIQGRRFDPRFKNGEDALFMFSISDRFQFVDYTSTKAIYYRRYRENSAVTSKKTSCYIFKNTLHLSVAYSSIFFRHPLDYKLGFFINRLMATFRSMIYTLKHDE